ncbi:unnamed protein product [Rhizopus stolonifer]
MTNPYSTRLNKDFKSKKSRDGPVICQVCSVVNQQTLQFKNNKGLKQHFNSKTHIDCLNVPQTQLNQRLVQRTHKPNTFETEMANSPGMDIDYDDDALDYFNNTSYFDFNRSRPIESFGSLPINEDYYLIEGKEEEEEGKDENELDSEDEVQHSNDDSIESSAVFGSNSESDASDVELQKSDHDEPWCQITRQDV